MPRDNNALSGYDNANDTKHTANQSNGIAFAGKTSGLAQMLATAQLMAICAAMGMPFVQEEL